MFSIIMYDPGIAYSLDLMLVNSVVFGPALSYTVV